MFPRITARYSQLSTQIDPVAVVTFCMSNGAQLAFCGPAPAPRAPRRTRAASWYLRQRRRIAALCASAAARASPGIETDEPGAAPYGAWISGVL
jgi:hypothetical protein